MKDIELNSIDLDLLQIITHNQFTTFIMRIFIVI